MQNEPERSYSPPQYANFGLEAFETKLSANMGLDAQLDREFSNERFVPLESPQERREPPFTKAPQFSGYEPALPETPERRSLEPWERESTHERFSRELDFKPS